ncbi:hypothetical protein ACHWQZ_G001513 [Mnemiopsis leidyi]
MTVPATIAQNVEHLLTCEVCTKSVETCRSTTRQYNDLLSTIRIKKVRNVKLKLYVPLDKVKVTMKRAATKYDFAAEILDYSLKNNFRADLDSADPINSTLNGYIADVLRDTMPIAEFNKLPKSSRDSFKSSFLNQLLKESGLPSITELKTGLLAASIWDIMDQIKVSLPTENVLICTLCARTIELKHHERVDLQSQVLNMLRSVNRSESRSQVQRKSAIGKVDWSKCFCCQEERPGDKLVSKWTNETLDQIKEIILLCVDRKSSITDPGISSRVQALSLHVSPLLHVKCRMRYRFHFRQLSHNKINKKRIPKNQGVPSKRQRLVLGIENESCNDDESVVDRGIDNESFNDDESVVEGGIDNESFNDDESVVDGGIENEIFNDDESVVDGGIDNESCNDDESVVDRGIDNESCNDDESFVDRGIDNESCNDDESVVDRGIDNESCIDDESVVDRGIDNESCIDDESVVDRGIDNESFNDDESVVEGGIDNESFNDDESVVDGWIENESFNDDESAVGCIEDESLFADESTVVEADVDVRGNVEDKIDTKKVPLLNEIRQEITSYKAPPMTLPLVVESAPLPTLEKTIAAITGVGIDPVVQYTTVILAHHSKKRRRKTKSKDGEHRSRCSSSQEPTLMRATSIWLYLRVKSKTVMQYLHGIGVVLSYHRIRAIIDSIVAQDLTMFREIGALVPRELRKSLLTFGMIDNVDKSARNTTGTSFHGTSISVVQLEYKDSKGAARRRGPLQTPPNNFLYELDEVFKPKQGEASVFGDTTYQNPVEELTEVDEQVLIKKMQPWLRNIHETLTNRVYNGDQAYTSNVYHSKEDTKEKPKVINSILPIFDEPPNTADNMLHFIKVVKDVVQHLNPGQYTIIGVDQPLYALGKKIQLSGYHPEVDITKVFLIMGPLHIQQELLIIHGNLIEGTGLLQSMNDCEMSFEAPGTAAVNANFITRAFYLVQVIAASLGSLLNEEFQSSGSADFETWKEIRCKESDSFFFWNLILNFELLIILFVRAVRNRDFDLYVDVLAACVPYFFATDKVNYARWTPIHIAEIRHAKKNNSDLYKALEKTFSISKLQKKGSAIGLDQLHEQNNEKIKRLSGGLSFLGSDQEVVRLKWAIYTPVLANATNIVEERNESDQHHEKYSSYQLKFIKRTESLKAKLRDVKSPFSSDLKVLSYVNNGELLPNNEAIMKDIRALVSSVGLPQYQAYHKDRLLTNDLAVSDTISKNALVLPSRADAVRSKETRAMDTEERKIVAGLKHAAPHRPDAVLKALQYDYNDEPTVFVRNEEVYKIKKSSILGRLREAGAADGRRDFDVSLVDLSCVVRKLVPRAKNTTILEFSKIIYEQLLKLAEQHSTNIVCAVTDRVRNIRRRSKDMFRRF